MSKQKARKNRPAGTASMRKRFVLNAHKAAIIVGLISLVGVLAASMFSNWDKLRGNQATQASPDTTGDILVYNEQRRTLVEDAFDQALDNLQHARDEATGENAAIIDGAYNSLKEKKTEVGNKYDLVAQAIKDKKSVKAEIHKTELNSIIVRAQKDYDEIPVRLRPEWRGGQRVMSIDLDNLPPGLVEQVKKCDKVYLFMDDGTPRSVVRVKRNYLIPPITFPSGKKMRERNDRLTLEYEALASATSVNGRQKKQTE